MSATPAVTAAIVRTVARGERRNGTTTQTTTPAIVFPSSTCRHLRTITVRSTFASRPGPGTGTTTAVLPYDALDDRIGTCRRRFLQFPRPAVSPYLRALPESYAARFSVRCAIRCAVYPCHCCRSRKSPGRRERVAGARRGRRLPGRRRIVPLRRRPAGPRLAASGPRTRHTARPSTRPAHAGRGSGMSRRGQRRSGRSCTRPSAASKRSCRIAEPPTNGRAIAGDRRQQDRHRLSSSFGTYSSEARAWRWRWRWDLNPRTCCHVTRFRGVLLRPLGHATINDLSGDRAAARRTSEAAGRTPAPARRRSPRAGS